MRARVELKLNMKMKEPTIRKKEENEIFRRVVGHLGNGVEVVGDPGHYVAGLGVVEIVEGELLNVPEDVLPHVVLHADTEYMPPLHPDELEDHFRKVDAHHQSEIKDHSIHIPEGMRSCRSVRTMEGISMASPDESRATSMSMKNRKRWGP